MCIALVKIVAVAWLSQYAVADNGHREQNKSMSSPAILPNTQLSPTNINRSKREAYSIRIAEQNSGSFTVVLHIGGIIRSFNVLIDTATQATWISSSKFTASNAKYIGIANYEVPNDETSQFLRSYKGHKLWGTVKTQDAWVDLYCLGDSSVEVIHEMEPIPEFFGEFEGVFGLAPNPGDLTEKQSFCSWVQKNQPRSERFFTLWYPLGMQRNYGAAELGIGAINPAHMLEPLVYLPVVTTGLWCVNVTRISLGHFTLCENNCEVVFDSSSREVLGEKAALEMAEILFWPASGDVDCKTLGSRPIFTLVASGKEFTWTMREVAIEIGKKCKFGFLPDPLPAPGRWTFGNQLMRKLYTVFDVQMKMVGIARAKFTA